MTQFRTISRCSYVHIKSQENLHNLATWNNRCHEGRTALTESDKLKQVPSDRFDKLEKPRALKTVCGTLRPTPLVHFQPPVNMLVLVVCADYPELSGSVHG